jgi:hypothetical protein
MTDFEFVVSNGAPTRATAAVRSHAVKRGLQRKQSSKEGFMEGKESQLTIRQKSTLTGRFRVAEKDVSSAKRKAPKRKEKDDALTCKDNAIPSDVTVRRRQRQQLESWLQSRTPTLKQPNPQQLMDHIPLLFSHGLNVVIKFCQFMAQSSSGRLVTG